MPSQLVSGDYDIEEAKAAWKRCSFLYRPLSAQQLAETLDIEVGTVEVCDQLAQQYRQEHHGISYMPGRRIVLGRSRNTVGSAASSRAGDSRGIIPSCTGNPSGNRLQATLHQDRH